MSRLMYLLQREPAAIGALVASVLPVLVIAGLLHADGKTIAAVVVAVNALAGFAVRLSVTPVAAPAPAAAPGAAPPGAQVTT